VLHISGPADADFIDKLVRQVKQKINILVHPDNASGFEKYEPYTYRTSF